MSPCTELTPSFQWHTYSCGIFRLASAQTQILCALQQSKTVSWCQTCKDVSSLGVSMYKNSPLCYDQLWTVFTSSAHSSSSKEVNKLANVPNNRGTAAWFSSLPWQHLLLLFYLFYLSQFLRSLPFSFTFALLALSSSFIVALSFSFILSLSFINSLFFLPFHLAY